MARNERHDGAACLPVTVLLDSSPHRRGPAPVQQGALMRPTLHEPARMSSQDTCVSCGFGDDRSHGHLVFVGGQWIHYFACLNRNLPVPPKGERMEQATSAPGEVRNVEIPKKKQ